MSGVLFDCAGRPPSPATMPESTPATLPATRGLRHSADRGRDTRGEFLRWRVELSVVRTLAWTQAPALKEDGIGERST
jgi:hypothetical protein